MANIEVRFLTLSDLPEARKVAGIFRERPGPVDDTAMQDFLKDPNCFVVAAFNGNEALGCIVAYRLKRFDGDPMELYVHAVDVVESQRRQGIGREMIDFLKGSLRELDCAELWLITERDNEAAVALYTSTGGKAHAEDKIIFEWLLSELN